MKTKIAVLSNVNMNFMLRMLKDEFDVYETEGYGNELGVLLNPGSTYHEFDAKFTFFIMDLMEVLEHDLTDYGIDSNPHIKRWFSLFESGIDANKLYYVSDACLWGMETEALFDSQRKLALEYAWTKSLSQICEKHSNVRIFPYRKLIEKLGEDNSFSLKMWYMGKILHTNEAQGKIAGAIKNTVNLYTRTPKKVLLLDLDNTLWGGIAGEHDKTPVVLSDDHTGLAYKNLQRVIKQMQENGVVLGIVSKNNEADAMAIIDGHSHMVLRSECFAVKRINWNNKHENIIEIANELNLGLDSFVFFDDNPTERELVKQMLPQVMVPDFPKRPEELAGVMLGIYHEYFEKAVLTKEDLAKTKQYAENAKRVLMQESVSDFNEYLKQLEIVVKPVDAAANAERLVQLVNKTNQFNLTTKRYEEAEMLQVLKDKNKLVYLYQVKDCFGDYGIVSAVIVDVSTQIPVMEEFVMSCRVMGKRIENAIVEDVEKHLYKKGYSKLKTMYLKTEKNKPVENLFESLGYTVTFKDGENKKEYEIDLSHCPNRDYCVKMDTNVQ
ncbi:MAG: HAD-IIIC family phosphatase [Lachnospiraceae bacterium]|nr:HAD-IIIC family phosphatase [Lachnospiraceae bacterium]